MQPHGIMFHHFYDATHPRGQGAMSARELEELILSLGTKRILPAREWVDRAAAGTLSPNHLCLTFDDNLRCQFDVAYPVLKKFGLTAFWFVYTSVLQGKLERLELYRQFRTLYFSSVDSFYDAFIRAVECSDGGRRILKHLAGFNPRTYLAQFPFYTESDRQFRFLRDEVLGPDAYHRVMDELFVTMNVDVRELSRGLWMDEACLRQLHADGHVIGLHSHTHPTRVEHLSAAEQRREYSTNRDTLTSILGERPTVMSHPCNSYNDDTLNILRDLGITLGFRANMAQSRFSNLEYPREDHANLLAKLAA
jgi:peptidoglycan/xylan/chitin deacetylase (PgdA/CDA1 family)